MRRPSKIEYTVGFIKYRQLNTSNRYLMIDYLNDKKVINRIQLLIGYSSFSKLKT